MSSLVLERPALTGGLDDLIALWERVLQQAPIFPDDNFFDLGGDSLAAVKLFHEIEQKTGRKLPITSIYDVPTPAALAALLDEPETAAPFSPLVPMKPGRGAPLFIAHGLGGNVMELSALAKRLATDRPVYAIQPKGLDGLEAPHDRVEAMADYYLRALRDLQPRGPYFLAGYSFGGLIALEMARRLKQAGETIALLAFIDSYPHPHHFPLLDRAYVKLRTGLGRDPGLGLAPAAIAAGPALQRVYDASYAALLHYRPRPYEGRVVFLRPNRSLFPVHPAKIWVRYVDEIDLHTVPGDHDSMVRAEVGALAATFSACLAAAEEAR